MTGHYHCNQNRDKYSTAPNIRLLSKRSDLLSELPDNYMHATLNIIFSLYIKMIMVVLHEDPIEKFIRENKDEFGASNPPENHMGKFLVKLNRRVRHLISIVPYLIKLAAATILIFTASIIIWNNFLRRDREVLTLKYKITIVLDRLIN